MCSMLFMASDTNFMEGYFTDISLFNHLCFYTATSQTGVEILKGEKPCKFKNEPTKRTEKPKQESRWKVGSQSKNLWKKSSLRGSFINSALSSMLAGWWEGSRYNMRHHFWYQESLPPCLVYLPDTEGRGESDCKPHCDPGCGVDRQAPTAEANSTNCCNEEKTPKIWA